MRLTAKVGPDLAAVILCVLLVKYVDIAGQTSLRLLAVAAAVNDGMRRVAKKATHSTYIQYSEGAL